MFSLHRLMMVDARKAGLANSASAVSQRSGLADTEQHCGIFTM